MAVGMTNQMREMLNEKLKGWLMSGQVAVFLPKYSSDDGESSDWEQISAWFPLKDDLTSDAIRVTKTCADARFRILDGKGDFYCWLSLFPSSTEIIHEGDTIWFPGLEFV
jgi:hypothetical protein